MIRRVIRYFASLATAGVLAGLGAVLSPAIWPPDPDASLTPMNGQLVGETIGYVWAADPNTATIQISSSLVGLRAFPVRVTPDTRITDGDKEGAFGDLGKHMRVHVIYESGAHGRVASSIELLRSGAPATPAMVAHTGPAATETVPTAGYWVELGTFADAEAAGTLVTRLLEHNLTVSVESVTTRGGRHRVLRVQVGPFPDEAAATAAQQNLRAIGYQAHAISM
jgi:SPOR domain